MAKKINKSFAEELRSSAYVWLGEVDTDMYLLLINFNKTTHWVVVQEDSETLIIKGLKETTCLDREIFDALYEINPAWKKKHIGILNISSCPAVKITRDCNNTLFKREIKPLKESTVIPFLTSLGVDVSSYTYTHLVVDNTHDLKPACVTKGYSNYSKEVNQFMVDTSKYKTYIMDKKDEYEMLDMGCFCGIIAAGPAGTGKSTDPLIYCAKEEIPVVVFQCTPGTEEDAIIGNFIPNNSGGFSLKRGPLANAIEQDCWLVINEANYVPSGILSCLNSVMDDNAQVLLDDGSMLKRGPNFRLILTVNPGYRGTNMFNEATLNRFATVYYEPINKKTLISRLKQESGYKNDKVLEAVAEQFDKLRGIYQSKNMETEVTYRNALRFLKMILLAPNVSIEKQFDMAFVNNAIFEMNDIQVELNDLKDIRKDMLNDINSALNEGTEDVTESSWSCSPRVDFDMDGMFVGEDGSFSGPEEDK